MSLYNWILIFNSLLFIGYLAKKAKRVINYNKLRVEYSPRSLLVYRFHKVQQSSDYIVKPEG